jgi:hypothetical protein
MAERKACLSVWSIVVRLPRDSATDEAHVLVTLEDLSPHLVGNELTCRTLGAQAGMPAYFLDAVLIMC